MNEIEIQHPEVSNNYKIFLELMKNYKENFDDEIKYTHIYEKEYDELELHEDTIKIVQDAIKKNNGLPDNIMRDIWELKINFFHKDTLRRYFNIKIKNFNEYQYKTIFHQLLSKDEKFSEESIKKFSDDKDYCQNLKDLISTEKVEPKIRKKCEAIKSSITKWIELKKRADEELQTDLNNILSDSKKEWIKNFDTKYGIKINKIFEDSNYALFLSVVNLIYKRNLEPKKLSDNEINRFYANLYDLTFPRYANEGVTLEINFYEPFLNYISHDLRKYYEIFSFFEAENVRDFEKKFEFLITVITKSRNGKIYLIDMNLFKECFRKNFFNKYFFFFYKKKQMNNFEKINKTYECLIK